MLEANPSLCVFGVGFQLYSQLKYSLHESIGVLDSTAVLMVSQTTRLDKDSSIIVWDEQYIFEIQLGKSILKWN